MRGLTFSPDTSTLIFKEMWTIYLVPPKTAATKLKPVKAFLNVGSTAEGNRIFPIFVLSLFIFA